MITRQYAAQLELQNQFLNILLPRSGYAMQGWNFLTGNLCVNRRGLLKDIINRTFAGNAVSIPTMRLYSYIEEQHQGEIILEIDHPKFSGTCFITVDMNTRTCSTDRLRRAHWEYLRGYFKDASGAPNWDPIHAFLHAHPGNYQLPSLDNQVPLAPWAQLNPAKNAFRQYAESTIVDRDMALTPEQIQERRELSSNFIETRYGSSHQTIQQMGRVPRQMKMHSGILRIIAFDLCQVGEVKTAQMLTELSDELHMRAMTTLSAAPKNGWRQLGAKYV